MFPILIPPLRERREDIRPLIEHFVVEICRADEEVDHSIPSKAMEMMVRWDWPGNIRELENFVERSVILTPGSICRRRSRNCKSWLSKAMWEPASVFAIRSVNVFSALCGTSRGKLGGPDGAAARLGLKRTTLQSKLDQFGIKPGSYR